MGGEERYVYVFRAMHHRRRDLGEDEIDEDHLSHRMGRSFTDEAAATDPFKEPEPSQASRIEKIVAELAKTDRVTRLSMRTLRGQAASEARAAGLTDI